MDIFGAEEFNTAESEFNEFEPRLKSALNRFQLSAGLNLETLNTNISGTNNIWAASQIRQIPVSIERRLNWIIEYNFKWNQPYFSRLSN